MAVPCVVSGIDSIAFHGTLMILRFDTTNPDQLLKWSNGRNPGLISLGLKGPRLGKGLTGAMSAWNEGTSTPTRDLSGSIATLIARIAPVRLRVDLERKNRNPKNPKNL